MNPLKKYWYERLHDGAICFGEQQWNVAAPYNIDTLFDHFFNFGRERINFFNPPLKDQFSKELGALLPDEKTAGMRLRGRQNISDKITDNTVKISVRMFPPLDLCRKSFEDVIGQPVDWDDAPVSQDELSEEDCAEQFEYLGKRK